MADGREHSVDAGDERRHLPGEEQLWGESYYLDFVSESGDLAGYTRIGVYPNLAVSWWTSAIVGAGRPLSSSIDHHLPLAGDPASGEGGFALRAPGLAVEYDVSDPLSTMAVRGEAPAVVLDDPALVYTGAKGTSTSVGFDLEWATDGSPYHYDVTTRYEIPCLVRGEIVVGGERIAVEGQGQRDHSWGVRDWWAFGWCWAAARLDDGTRVHVADIRMPGMSVGLGYVQRGGEVIPVEGLSVDESIGAEGVPEWARIRVDSAPLEIEVEPLWFAPALLVAPDGRQSRFPRACADFRCADGRSGPGWIEWNQPQPASSTDY